MMGSSRVPICWRRKRVLAGCKICCCTLISEVEDGVFFFGSDKVDCWHHFPPYPVKVEKGDTESHAYVIVLIRHCSRTHHTCVALRVVNE